MITKKNWMSLRSDYLSMLASGIEAWRNDYPGYYGIDIIIQQHGVENDGYFTAQIYYIKPEDDDE